jgi:hypothetical protein
MNRRVGALNDVTQCFMGARRPLRRQLCGRDGLECICHLAGDRSDRHRTRHFAGIVPAHAVDQHGQAKARIGKHRIFISVNGASGNR